MKRDPRDLLGDVPRPGSPAEADRAAALERPAGGPGRRDVLVASPWPPCWSASRRSSPPRTSGCYPPQCGTGHAMILAAQAVPSAALVPCVAALPSGWQVGGADIASGHATVLAGLRPGRPAGRDRHPAAACDVSGAQQIPSDEPGTRRFERPAEPGADRFAGLRFYTFPGGCVTYQFDFAPGASPLLAIRRRRRGGLHAPGHAGGLRQDTEGLALCGRGAACPGERAERTAWPRRSTGSWPSRGGTSPSPRSCWRSPRRSSPRSPTTGLLAHIQRAGRRVAAAHDLGPVGAGHRGRQGPQPARARLRHASGPDRHRRLPGPAPPVVASGRVRRRPSLLSEVLIGTLKGIYDRARPPGSLVATSGASFPSGHADRRLGHRRRRGHRAGAARAAAGRVGRGRGGLLGPDGALACLPRCPLAVRRDRRGAARDLVRPAGRPRGGRAPAPLECARGVVRPPLRPSRIPPARSDRL